MGLFNRIKHRFAPFSPPLCGPVWIFRFRAGSICTGEAFIWARRICPLPSGLIKLLKRADALIVEADISGHESPFAGLESGRPGGTS